MNSFDILEGFSGLDDSLLEASERPNVKKIKWTRLTAAAACLCLVALGVVAAARQGAEAPVVLSGPGKVSTEESEKPDKQEKPADTEEPIYHLSGEAQVSEPMPLPMIVYNKIASVDYAMSSPAQGVSGNYYMFGEALTDEELAAAAPEMAPEGMTLSGTASYYGWGELESIHLNYHDDTWDGDVDVELSYKSHTFVTTGAETPELVKGSFAGQEYTAYSFETDGLVQLWLDFKVEDVNYTMKVDAATEDEKKAETAMASVLVCYYGIIHGGNAPDLESIHTLQTDTLWVDEELSFSDARADETFGALMPDSVPAGFSPELIRRHVSVGEDSLYCCWTDGGYGYLVWQASYFSDADAENIVGVEEREKYDLTLCKLPLCDSVPEELIGVINDPVFRIGELSQDTVNARAVKSDDGGVRINFKVLTEDGKVIRISAKGVSPEWIYEQLSLIKDPPEDLTYPQDDIKCGTNKSGWN